MNGVSIGRQRVGAKRDYREERILAINGLALDATQGGAGFGNNELALDATIGRSGYWQAMSWR
jgi:hypothetical protein